MSVDAPSPTGSAAEPPARAHLTWDGGAGCEVLVSAEDALATVTAALRDGQVVSFPLPEDATLVLNGAQLAAVTVSPPRSGSPAEKHIGM